MSDWEVVPDNNQSSGQGQAQPQSIDSDWEIVHPEPNSMQAPQNNESLGMAALKAVPRMGEDIYRGGMNFLKNIPNYYQTAKSEVPGAFNAMYEHPAHAAGQALAGLGEMGQNTFNIPYDIANYATNRLNLIPQDINQKIQMARMPDSEQDINATLGQPKYPGESLIRGTTRNALNLLGVDAAVNAVNPFNLTAKSIANDVVKTGRQQEIAHTKQYNKIWNKADKSGYNEVPVDQKKLSDNLSLIEKYKTPREYQSLEDFILTPSLQNAQKAQSDMGVMKRNLQEKSRTSSLTSEELKLYNAAHDSEKHIENNMFKNDKGDVNNSLKNKYQKLTNSYRENVVPYKYNRSIQAYKNNEMLPNELVNSLSRGEFAAKKGNAHPQIAIRNALLPTAKGISLLGAGGVGAYLYNQMFGNKPPE